MKISELLDLQALSPARDAIILLSESSRRKLVFAQIARLGDLLRYPLHQITMTPLRKARLDRFYRAINDSFTLGAAPAVQARLELAFEAATQRFIELRGGDETAAKAALDLIHDAKAVAAFEAEAPGVLQQCIDEIEEAAGYVWTIAAVSALESFNESLKQTTPA